jgi:hypothetical protein
MDNAVIISRGNIWYILIMILSVITVASFGSITHVSAVSSDDNLTKVFDCIDQKANEKANLSLVDAFVCYDKGLPGAVKYSGEPYQNPDLSSLGKVQPVSFNTPVNTGANDKGEDKAGAKTTSILKQSDKGEDKAGAKTTSILKQSDKGEDKAGAKTTSILKQSDKGEDKFAFTPINENVKAKPNSKISKQSDDNKGIHLSQEISGTPNKHKITKQSSDPIDAVTSPNAQSKSPVDSSSRSIDIPQSKSPVDSSSRSIDIPQSKSPVDSITSSDPTDLIPLVLPFSELGSP